MTQTDPRLAAVGKLLGSEPIAVRPLSGGTHAQTFSATTDRGDVVIRPITSRPRSRALSPTSMLIRRDDSRGRPWPSPATLHSRSRLVRI